MPNYRVLLCDTRTGSVLDEVPFSDFQLTQSVDWARIDTLTVTVPLRGARSQTRNRTIGAVREPWKRSLLIMRDDRALFAGPVVSGSWSQETAEFSCAGIAKLLERRFIFSDPADKITVTADARDAMGWLLWWAIDEYEVDGDARFRLPLTNTTVVGSTMNTTVRTWLAKDLPAVYESVKKVADEDGAPDVRFSTQIDADQKLVSWRAEFGDPYLGTDVPAATWNYPGQIREISGSVDGTPMLTRGYILGDEQAEDRLIVFHDNDLTDDGYPWMDATNRDASSTRDLFAARALAQSFAETGRDVVESWDVSVNPESRLFEELVLGDNNMFRVEGHAGIDDGEYIRRVTGYTLSPNSLTLETLQPLEV